MAATELILLVAGIIAIGVLAQLLADRLQVPTIIFYIGAGLLLGPIAPYLPMIDARIIGPGSFGDALPAVVGLAVAIIVFEGAFHLKLERIREAPSAAVRIVTIGALIALVGTAVAVKFLGDEPPTFSEAGIEVSMYDGGTFETLLVESPAAFERYREAVLEGVADGGRAIFLPTGGEGEWELDGTTVSTRPVAGFELTEPHHEEMPEFESGLPFVARNEDEPETAAFERDDFGFWYNGEADRRDLLTDTVLEGDDLVSLLYTWETDGSDAADTAKRSGSKTRLPVVARRAHGDGSLVFCELRLDGRVGNEPVLDRFLRALVTTSV
mgnify:CR=1 FL=1